MPFALALASMAPSSSSPSSKWQREIMPFARDFSIAHTHKSPQYCTFTILRRHDEIANNKFTRNEIKSTTLLIDLAVRRIFGDHKSRPCALATTKYFLNFIRNTHVCGYVYYHWKKNKNLLFMPWITSSGGLVWCAFSSSCRYSGLKFISHEIYKWFWSTGPQIVIK